MIELAVIDAMVASGCSVETLAAAVKADTKAEQEKLLERRYKATIRKRNQRSRLRDNVGQSGTPLPPSPPFDKERSPTPPKEITTPLNPPPQLIPTSSAQERNPRQRLFSDGLAMLQEITGKGPDGTRRLLARWLRDCGDEAINVLGLIEDAKREQVADPVSWITVRLRTRPPPDYSAAKPATLRQSNLKNRDNILHDTLQLFTSEPTGTRNIIELNPRLPQESSGALGRTVRETLPGSR